MFICPCYRVKNGKRHVYWALMESYRTARGPRQRVVAYLGQLDERGRLGVKEAAEGKRPARQKRLFDDVTPEWVEIDIRRVRAGGSFQFQPTDIFEMRLRLDSATSVAAILGSPIRTPPAPRSWTWFSTIRLSLQPRRNQIP